MGDLDFQKIERYYTLIRDEKIKSIRLCLYETGANLRDVEKKFFCIYDRETRGYIFNTRKLYKKFEDFDIESFVEEFLNALAKHNPRKVNLYLTTEEDMCNIKKLGNLCEEILPNDFK